MTREYDITYIYADEMPKLKALLTQSVEGRQWVSTSIHNGSERWKFCRFENHTNHVSIYVPAPVYPLPKPKKPVSKGVPYAGKE